MRTVRRLTRPEEAELARRIGLGHEDALDELVESNLPFVIHIVRGYRNRGLPFDDLLNEGSLGLIEAARRFDPARNVPFVSYAVWWIRKAIVEALRKAPTVVPPRPRGPAHAATDEGHPTQVRHTVMSLEDFATPENLQETLVAPARHGAEHLLLEQESVDLVQAALSALRPKERFVLEHRFGLNGRPSRTLQGIGTELGLSREWVRQVEMRAKQKLRVRLARLVREPGPSPNPGS